MIPIPTKVFHDSMSKVFPRHCKSALPTISHGEGCYLIDQSGKRYLDGSGGAAVSCLGHSDPEITSAVQQQLNQIAFAHTGFFTSEPAEQLAELLVSLAPKDIDRVYFVSGGSEAVEAALKLARQYFLEKGETERCKVISRQQSYHGNTLGALAAGGNMWRRQPFLPMMTDTTYIEPCYRYRGQHEGESYFDYGQRMANQLDQAVTDLGAENVMAFIAEPVVGATLGAVPAEQGYFKRIREICDSHGILLILDEVMCGMGRTGSLFACQQDEVEPDIITVAKGLGAGYQPVGAMLCSGEIYQTIADGSGFFQHGHTCLGHPTACAAGLAVVTAISERGLVQRCRQQGAKTMEALQQKFTSHPNVGDIRGRGLFLGLELVRDKFSKEPFDPFLGVNKKLKRAAFEAGLICYSMGGTIDGQQGDHVLLAPPFIIEDIQIEELVDKLSIAIEHAVADSQ